MTCKLKPRSFKSCISLSFSNKNWRETLHSCWECCCKKRLGFSHQTCDQKCDNVYNILVWMYGLMKLKNDPIIFVALITHHPSIICHVMALCGWIWDFLHLLHEFTCPLRWNRALLLNRIRMGPASFIWIYGIISTCIIQ